MRPKAKRPTHPRCTTSGTLARSSASWTMLRRRHEQSRCSRARAPLTRHPALGLQTLLDAGYEEDMFISNTKICARHAAQRAPSPSRRADRRLAAIPSPPVLGLSTCASALLAQFYPLPFPQNYVLLVACIVVYFVLNTALQVRRPPAHAGARASAAHANAHAQVFSYVCEKDIILSTHPKEARPACRRAFARCRL